MKNLFQQLSLDTKRQLIEATKDAPSSWESIVSNLERYTDYWDLPYAVCADLRFWLGDKIDLNKIYKYFENGSI